MSAETAQQHDTLTPEQLAAVERARNTPYVVSQSHRRPPGEKRWTHESAITLNQDVDIVALLKRERERMIARKMTKRPETSSQ